MDGLTAPLAIETDWTHTALLYILGYSLLAGVIAMGTAFVYRKATAQPIPVGPVVLTGVSFPALLLTIEGLFQGVVIEGSSLEHYSTGAYLLGVFGAGTTTGFAGRRLGDHLACGVFNITSLDGRGEVADLVRSAGLSVAVTLPEQIADADGYDPVSDALKQELSGLTMRFPRRVSPENLAKRLCTRLERDYGVGYAHADVAADGTIEAVAVGATSSGLSRLIPPAHVAVTIRGDPPQNATVGDPLEVWSQRTDSSQLVVTGTFLSKAGDTTTLLIDERDHNAVDGRTSYRLGTSSDAPTDHHELVSLVLRATETVITVSVDDSSPLEGEFVGWIPGTVLLIRREGTGVAFPDENETIIRGDTVYVFGTPRQLRRVRNYDSSG